MIQAPIPKLGYFLRPIPTSPTIKNTVSLEPAPGLYPGFSASGQDVWVPYYDYEGDAIILSAVGAQSGKTFEATGRWGGVANTTGFALLRRADRRFFWYLTNQPGFWERGGAAQPYVKVSESLQKRIRIPCSERQRAIAEFLDEKCAKVDEAVRIKEEQIALLRERRQILIQQAVTRGLNPDAPMKDSGIDWIGKIPAHWETNKLKHLFQEKRHRPNLCLGSGAISFGEVIEKDDERVPLATKASYQEVLAGEFLVNPLNLNFDLKSLRIALSEINVVVSAGYIVLQARTDIEKRYFKYLLRRYDIAHMKLLGAGVRQTISFTHLADSMLITPPLTEQQTIATFLDDKCAEVDIAVQAKEEQIAALKEYKTTLINAAVTGKIKVA